MTRTPDLHIRSVLLYPTELRAPVNEKYCNTDRAEMPVFFLEFDKYRKIPPNICAAGACPGAVSSTKSADRAGAPPYVDGK